MQKDEGITKLNKIKVTTASGKKHRKEKIMATQSTEEGSKKPENILKAAETIANLMGNDKKKVEFELLSKLLGRHADKIETTGAMSSNEKSSMEEEDRDEKPLNLKDIIVGMKVDKVNRTQATLKQSRGQYVRKMIEERKEKNKNYQQIQKDKSQKTDLSHGYSGSVKLFGSKTLGIFKNEKELNQSPDLLKTWEYLFKKELKFSVTHPPANYFQKMILWTDQKKIWKFPIDNEQGLEDEAKVDFSEHVFIEQYLENWCPTKGPIRHFMELVCVGLSKNPYITAKEKQEHILWYRNYFEEKKDILKELIVQGEDEIKTKQITDEISKQ